MVRVFLKGGVWKNSEDEVLKAAVQKYGKQQWARVASLLNRKTAKQAKARWYEWLDPSIRKTEWSRAEEEKLLHLAKLMPAQWKTIAPLVGRTATQCQEHYEYLLDQAVSGGSGGDGAASSDELRKQSSALRPGQIDSHPETKPARPDPIDMDEDELEMLQEARARLANTQGKKAKRKQREKMLQQAKRLADLQKRRELKQAGLLSKQALKKSKKRRNEIDYGVEIPFHKPAPVGFHDTSGEQDRAEKIRQKRLTQVDFQKINENRYRSRDYEEMQRKKKEEKRLKYLEEENQKFVKAKEEREKKEPNFHSRPRGILKLPEPTVTDAELAQMSKQQSAGGDHDSIAESGNVATLALLGDYSDRPLPTPMRTPATASLASGRQQQQRDLVREASQLRMLERVQTPLLASTSGDAHDEYDDEENEGEGTSTQRGKQQDAKISAAATPRVPDRAGVGRTPGSVATRDYLSLNRSSTSGQHDDAASVGASTFASSRYSIREIARQERLAAKRARRELELALAALPAPQFEYELAVPADDAMEVDDDDNALAKVETVMDQADVEAAERERLRKEAAKMYEARSSVLKRKDLPRPTKIDPSFALLSPPSSTEQGLIQKEALTLMQHDAHAHPLASREEVGVEDSGHKKKKKRKHGEVEAPTVAMMEEVPPEVSLEYIAEDALTAAKELIQSEFEVLVNTKVSEATAATASYDSAIALLSEECSRTSGQGGNTLVYVKKHGWVAQSEKAKVDGLRLEFETLKAATEALRKKNDKQEAKLGVVNGGYAKRADKCGEEILQTFADIENAKIEQSVYRMLQNQEIRGGADRVEHMKSEVAKLRMLEAALQKEYGELVVEKRRLHLLNAKKE